MLARADEGWERRSGPLSDVEPGSSDPGDRLGAALIERCVSGPAFEIAKRIAVRAAGWHEFRAAAQESRLPRGKCVTRTRQLLVDL